MKFKRTTFFATIYFSLFISVVPVNAEIKLPNLRAFVCNKLLGNLVDKKVKYTKELNFSSFDEEKLKEIFKNPLLNDSEKLKKFYDLYLEIRTKNLSKASNFLTQAAIKNAGKPSSLYQKLIGEKIALETGPHYHPFLNRVGIKLYGEERLDHQNHLIDLSSLIHEIEHAIDRNETPAFFLTFAVTLFDTNSVFLYTPVFPTYLFHLKFKEIVAEWEFLRRIPQSIRDRQIQLIKLALLAWEYDVANDYELALIEIEGKKNLEDSDELEKVSQNISKRNQVYKNIRRLVEFETQIPSEVSKNGIDILFTNTKFISRFAFTEDFKKDFAAIINAKKEFEKKIENPQNDKKKSEKRIKDISLFIDFLHLALSTTEQSNLSKDEFVDLQLPARKYTYNQLLENHYKLGYYKLFLLLVSNAQVLYWTAHQSTDFPILSALDFNLIIPLIQFLKHANF